MFASSLHYYVYILLPPVIFQVILRSALQKPEVGGTVFHFSRPLECLHLSLSSPTLHIPSAEHFVCLSLADELRVVIVRFQQLDNTGGEVVDECVIGDKTVDELKKLHIT